MYVFKGQVIGSFLSKACVMGETLQARVVIGDAAAPGLRVEVSADPLMAFAIIALAAFLVIGLALYLSIRSIK